MKHNQITTQKGFTLIESMMVIAIIAIIATAAVISFNSWMDNTKSRSTVTTLRTSVHLARLEAIKRGGRVQICSSSNGIACSGNLSDGWIVYHDIDADQTLGLGEPIIFTEQITNNQSTLTMTDSSGDALPSFGFNHRGYSTNAVVVSSTKGSFTFNFGVSRIGRIHSL